MVPLDDKTVNVICSCTTKGGGVVKTLPFLSLNIVETIGDHGQTLAQKLFEIRRKQRQDPLIQRWRRYVIDGWFPEQHMRK